VFSSVCIEKFELFLLFVVRLFVRVFFRLHREFFFLLFVVRLFVRVFFRCRVRL